MWVASHSSGNKTAITLATDTVLGSSEDFCEASFCVLDVDMDWVWVVTTDCGVKKCGVNTFHQVKKYKTHTHRNPKHTWSKKEFVLSVMLGYNQEPTGLCHEEKELGLLQRGTCFAS